MVTLADFDDDVAKETDDVLTEVAAGVSIPVNMATRKAIGLSDFDAPIEEVTIVEDSNSFQGERAVPLDNRIRFKADEEYETETKNIEEARELYKDVDIDELSIKRKEIEGSAWDNNWTQVKFRETGENPFAVNEEKFSSEFEPLRIKTLEGIRKNTQKTIDNINSNLNSPNGIISSATNALLNTDMNLNAINAVITGVMYAPITGAAVDLANWPEDLRKMHGHWAAGRKWSAVGVVAASTAITALHGIGAGAILGKGAKALSNQGGKEAIERFAKADALANINRVEKIQAAKVVADENDDLRKLMQVEYAESLDPSLVKIVNGVKEVDYDAVRVAGRAKAEEIFTLQNKRAEDFLAKIPLESGKEVDSFIVIKKSDNGVDSRTVFEGPNAKETADKFAKNSGGEVILGQPTTFGVSSDIRAAYNVNEESIFLGMVDEAEELVSPLLKPEALNAMVAIASDLNKSGLGKFDPNKTVIDNLFDLTAEGKLGMEGADGLPELLGKYGLTFDDYVLAISGSASEAGRILQKMSMIRKAGPSTAATNRAKVQANMEGTLKRLENMRRGVLTSLFKTAVRNFTTVFIKSPFDGLETVVTDILKATSDDGVMKGVTTAFTSDTWKKGFGQWKYMFRKGGEANELTQYLLKNPGLGKKYDDLLGTVSELRRRTGNDTGKILPILERKVDQLTVFNRWQDHFVRKAVFAAEIQRLHLREYGTELFTVLDAGGVDDLIQGVGKYTHKGKKSFADLTNEAIKTSMQRTFAANPQLDIFDDIAKTWTRYGLTIFEEFPRFMLSSLEFMAEASGGGLILPAVRKTIGYQNRSMKAAGQAADSWKIREKGILGSLIETGGDRRQISRGAIGFAGVMTLSSLYTDGPKSNEDYKIINLPSGGSMDTSPMFPIRQELFLARWLTELKQGTAAQWFEAKEFIEVFTGSQFKTGKSNPFLDGVADILAGISGKEEDVFGAFKQGELIGRIFGDKLSTVIMPYTYITDAQRILGYRDSRLVDVKEDPNKGSGFWGGVESSLIRAKNQKGLNAPSSDEARPDRVSPYNASSERFAPILDMGFGWRVIDRDDEWSEVWKARGFKGWEVGKRTSLPSVKRNNSLQMNLLLEFQTDRIKKLETKFRNEYTSMPREAQMELAKTSTFGSLLNLKIGSEPAVERYIDTKLKPIMQDTITQVQSLVYEDPKQTADIIRLQDGYVRMYTSDQKKAARLEYKRKNKGEEPNYLDINSVLKLFDYADASKMSLNYSSTPEAKEIGRYKYMNAISKIRRDRR